jgi:hypothetical protein
VFAIADDRDEKWDPRSKSSIYPFTGVGERFAKGGKEEFPISRDK